MVSRVGAWAASAVLGLVGAGVVALPATAASGQGPWAQVSAGGSHTCAVTSSGVLYCWGFNGQGQSDVPGDLGTVSQVSAGSTHTCAVTTAGTVRCWGDNRGGQSAVPDDLGTVTQVSAGFLHTCAVTSAGTVRCWGGDSLGQSSVPEDLGTVSQVSAGSLHTCAVTGSGVLRCWGDNTNLQIAVPDDLGTVSQVSAGGNHTCAVTTSHLLRCWGWDTYGEIDVPADLGTVSEASAGGNHTCAVTTWGMTRCWGWNVVGQIAVPSDVQPVTLQVSAGGAHTCAVTTSGRLHCWGQETTVPIVPGSVLISSPAPSAAMVGGAPYRVTTQAGPSSGAVSLSAGPSGVCTATGSAVSFAGVGDCTVTATQAGDASFAEATDSQTFPVLPSNAFTLPSSGKANTRNGTVTLRVTLPGPGRLRLRPAGQAPVKVVTLSVPRGGTIRIVVQPTKPGMKQLRAQLRKHRVARLPVKVAVGFTPTGGRVNTRSHRYTLTLT